MKFTKTLIVLLLCITINSYAQNKDQFVNTINRNTFNNNCTEYDNIDPFSNTLTTMTKKTVHNLQIAHIEVTNITEAVGNISYKVYSNPILQNLTIENTQNNRTLMELYNSQGQLLLRINFIEDIEILNLNDYLEGSYYMKLNQTNIYKISKTQKL